METIIEIVSFTLLIGLALSPVLIVWGLIKLSIRYKFIIYLTLGLLTTAAITLTFGWWINTSDQMLLAHYGYDIDAMGNTERFEKVSPDNMERVKSLEIDIMGVGWPLKAFMVYVVCSPYLLIVYFAHYISTKKCANLL